MQDEHETHMISIILRNIQEDEMLEAGAGGSNEQPEPMMNDEDAGLRGDWRKVRAMRPILERLSVQTLETYPVQWAAIPQSGGVECGAKIASSDADGASSRPANKKPRNKKNPVTAELAGNAQAKKPSRAKKPPHQPVRAKKAPEKMRKQLLPNETLAPGAVVKRGRGRPRKVQPGDVASGADVLPEVWPMPPLMVQIELDPLEVSGRSQLAFNGVGAPTDPYDADGASSRPAKKRHSRKTPVTAELAGTAQAKKPSRAKKPQKEPGKGKNQPLPNETLAPGALVKRGWGRPWKVKPGDVASGADVLPEVWPMPPMVQIDMDPLEVSGRSQLAFEGADSMPPGTSTGTRRRPNWGASTKSAKTTGLKEMDQQPRQARKSESKRGRGKARRSNGANHAVLPSLPLPAERDLDRDLYEESGDPRVHDGNLLLGSSGYHEIETSFPRFQAIGPSGEMVRRGAIGPQLRASFPEATDARMTVLNQKLLDQTKLIEKTGDLHVYLNLPSPTTYSSSSSHSPVLKGSSRKSSKSSSNSCCNSVNSSRSVTPMPSHLDQDQLISPWPWAVSPEITDQAGQSKSEQGSVLEEFGELEPGERGSSAEELGEWDEGELGECEPEHLQEVTERETDPDFSMAEEEVPTAASVELIPEEACVGHSPAQCNAWVQEYTRVYCLALLVRRPCLDRNCPLGHLQTDCFDELFDRRLAGGPETAAALHAAAFFDFPLLTFAVWTAFATRLPSLPPSAPEWDLFPWQQADARKIAMASVIESAFSGRQVDYFASRLMETLTAEGEVDPAWAELSSALSSAIPGFQLSKGAIERVMRSALATSNETARRIDSEHVVRFALSGADWSLFSRQLLYRFFEMLSTEFPELLVEMIALSGQGTPVEGRRLVRQGNIASAAGDTDRPESGVCVSVESSSGGTDAPAAAIAPARRARHPGWDIGATAGAFYSVTAPFAKGSGPSRAPVAKFCEDPVGTQRMVFYANFHMRANRLDAALSTLKEGGVFSARPPNRQEAGRRVNPCDNPRVSQVVRRLLDAALGGDPCMALRIFMDIVLAQRCLNRPVDIDNCMEPVVRIAVDNGLGHILGKLLALLKRGDILSLNPAVFRAFVIVLHATSPDAARQLRAEASAWMTYPPTGSLVQGALRTIMFSSWTVLEMTISLEITLADAANYDVSRSIINFEVRPAESDTAPSVVRNVDTRLEAAISRCQTAMAALKPPLDTSSVLGNVIFLRPMSVARHLAAQRRIRAAAPAPAPTPNPTPVLRKAPPPPRFFPDGSLVLPFGFSRCPFKYAHEPPVQQNVPVLASESDVHTAIESKGNTPPPPPPPRPLQMRPPAFPFGHEHDPFKHAQEPSVQQHVPVLASESDVETESESKGNTRPFGQADGPSVQWHARVLPPVPDADTTVGVAHTSVRSRLGQIGGTRPSWNEESLFGPGPGFPRGPRLGWNNSALRGPGPGFPSRPRHGWNNEALRGRGPRFSTGTRPRWNNEALRGSGPGFPRGPRPRRNNEVLRGRGPRFATGARPRWNNDGLLGPWPGCPRGARPEWNNGAPRAAGPRYSGRTRPW